MNLTTEISIPCPHCGAETNKTIGWIQEHTDFQCAACSTPVTLHSDQLLEKIRQADKAVERIALQ